MRRPIATLGCTYEFAAGPAHATRSAEACRPTNELFDWAFAEAGYLIDHAEKIAIVFGYPSMEDFDFEGYDLEDKGSRSAVDEALMKGPEEFLGHIAPLWRGWEISWDDRGVDAFAAYLRERSIESIATQPVQRRKGGGLETLVQPDAGE